MKLISIVTPCFNEEENIKNCYQVIKDLFKDLKDYTYEHIFIDNKSNDNTVDILRDLAKEDKNVKIILNTRNFGQLKSPFYGLLQTKGEASILFVADLQDPAYLIKEFIKKWEDGYKIVAGVKTKSEEPFLMFMIRKLYYKIINFLSDENLNRIENFTGFGLYDKKVIDILRDFNDKDCYLRGLISELGFYIKRIEYTQPKRQKGKTKNNFFRLYDVGIKGVISSSILPLRLAVFGGFFMSFISLFISLVYLILKLLFWDSFSFGAAPIIVGLFFFSSIQLFFLGILGEYIGSIHGHIKNRPFVIEEERINFSSKSSGGG